jgi:hypothetical protein
MADQSISCIATLPAEALTPSSPTPHEFKVGDRVRNEVAGWTAEVVEIDTKGDRMKLCAGHSSSWYGNFHNFSLAPAEYVPAVGDVVEYGNNGEIGLHFYNGNDTEMKVILCNKSKISTASLMSMMWLSTDCRSNGSLIGRVSQSVNNWDDAGKALKAYFAAESKPTFTGTYEERQAQWVKHHGIEVGSKVKVVRKAEKGEQGWLKDWADTQTVPLDRNYTMEIEVIHDCGIETYWCNPYFPYFALEPVTV